MSESRFALDATMSLRSTDKDGHLFISKSHISKATVSPYYGREVPNSKLLGLDDDTIYYFLRDPQELARAVPTAAGKPILSKHTPVSSADHPEDLVVGAIGSNVEFNDPYLDADLSFWTDECIGGIETNVKRELSLGYRWVPMMTAGTHQGVAYDGVMTNIEVNHLAVVEAGRAGPDVLAADEALKTEIPPMKKTNWGGALLVTLGAITPKLAQDNALSTLVGESSRKTFDRTTVTTKLIAMDSALTEDKLKPAFDAFMALDADKDDNAEDEETDEEREEREKKEKQAEDEGKKAMDAAVSKEVAAAVVKIRAANDAARDVRPVVGDVIAQDSAESIYEFALDEMKIAHAGIKELPALKALYTLAKSQRESQPTVIAQDSSAFAAMFPNVK